jgi:hypothetical protein
MQSFLRPDEQAADSEIRRNLERSQTYKNAGKTALAVGTSALGIGNASKILPFLNELIPADLAMKGINKIAPKVGEFLKKGQSMGMDLKSGFQFLKDNLQNAQASQAKNPIQEFETNYAELSKALKEFIAKGQPPQAAAAILKTSSVFGNKVKKLEKEMGKDFIDYVLELFGSNQPNSAKGQQSQQVQQTGQAPMPQPNAQQQTQGSMQSGQPQQGNPQQGNPPSPKQGQTGQEALGAIIQKINQRLQGSP